MGDADSRPSIWFTLWDEISVRILFRRCPQKPEEPVKFYSVSVVHMCIINTTIKWALSDGLTRFL